MRAPDRGRVVAHAYRDDAVIAICRQKRTHGGVMALVLAPSTGAPPRGIRAAPTRPRQCSEGCKADRVGGEMLGCWRQLTLVLLRSPLVPSIQMYSARHLPF
jgi:hypothetical protein